MSKTSHRKIIETLEKHYAERYDQYGDSPQAVQYSDRDTQHARFVILADIIDDPKASVLDWGCGTGELLRYLTDARSFSGAYSGYDICAKMVESARKASPGYAFEQRNIFESPLEENFDYILVSGVFNNLVEGGDNAGFMKDALKLLMAGARKGLAFNALSRYVDYFDPGLFYCDPEEIFRFCKEELSPLVTLRHDYLVKPGAPPFEFTIHVHSTDEHVRTKRVNDLF